MKDLNLFNYNGQEVRTLLIAGEPHFVAADLVDILEIGRVHDAVRGLDEDERGTGTIRTLGGDQEVSVVTEAGMYSLVLRSRKTEAKMFKRWITHEVLPAIRKTGSYGQPARELTFEEKALEVLAGLNARVEEQRAQLAIAAPKAKAFDIFLSADGDYDVRDAAQLLHRDHDIQIGRTRLFRWMRDNSWLGKDNRPYQNVVDQGLLRVKASTFKFTRTNGQEQIAAPQVRITPKGLDRLRRDLNVAVTA